MKALMTIVARAAPRMTARTIVSRRRRAALPLREIPAGRAGQAWAMVGCVLRRYVAVTGWRIDERVGPPSWPDPFAEEEAELLRGVPGRGGLRRASSAGRFT